MRITQTLDIENTVTNKKVKLVLNETTMTVNGAPVSLSTPMYLVTRKDKNSEVLCIPAKKVLTALGYSYKWDKKKTLISVHDLIYFDWTADTKKATKHLSIILLLQKQLITQRSNVFLLKSKVRKQTLWIRLPLLEVEK